MESSEALSQQQSGSPRNNLCSHTHTARHSISQPTQHSTAALTRLVGREADLSADAHSTAQHSTAQQRSPDWSGAKLMPMMGRTTLPY